MLRSLLGSDTSCCDLLQSGLPRIPALPHPLKPCSYRDDQAQSYATGRPGLYNGCVVCRVVLPAPVRQRGLRFAPPSALRGTSGGATMTTLGGAGTIPRTACCNILPRARRTGFSHGVGVSPLATRLRPLYIRDYTLDAR